MPELSQIDTNCTAKAKKYLLFSSKNSGGFFREEPLNWK